MPLPLLAFALAILGFGTGLATIPLARRHLRARRDLGAASTAAAAVVGGALFALIGARVGATPALAGFLVLTTAGLALSIVDMAEKRLPNALVYPSSAAVGSLLVGAALLDGQPARAIGVVAGGAGLFALYLVLAVPLRGALGLGDVKLALLVGAAGGYLGLGGWFITLVAGFLINGAIALLALALRRTTLRGSIPFGPSMLAGALVAVLMS